MDGCTREITNVGDVTAPRTPSPSPIPWVNVVEWGSGVAEGLAEDRLEVELLRAHADEEGETRTVRISGIGPRWAGVPLPGSPAPTP